MKELHEKVCKKLMAKIMLFFYDKLGFRYIWEKFHPPLCKEGRRLPSTFMLWFISVCMGLYTLASIRYESVLNRLVNNVHLLVYQADTENWKSVIKELPRLQDTKIPYEPSFVNPVSSFKSLLPCYDSVDFQIIRTLESLISRKKEDLSHVDLRKLIISPGHMTMHEELRCGGVFSLNTKYGEFQKSNFSFSDLSKASLERNSFSFSNFKGTRLINSNMQECSLEYVNLDNANLSYANLKNSNLSGATMKRAVLAKTDLENANLCGVDLTETFGINSANLNNALYNSKVFDLRSIPDRDEIKKILLENCIDASRVDEFYSIFLSCYSTERATKFPVGFLPSDHGMIDLYKLKKNRKFKE